MRKTSLWLAFLGLTLAVGTALAQPAPPSLPDPKLTPGDVLPVTKEDICVPGYTKKIRDVPEAVKQQVYAEYGISSHKPREYEVDHLISLELGGSNSIKNLWPESYETEPWNAHVKDRLENDLHRLVCRGELDLQVAQQEIAKDWIASYKQHFHTDQPLAKGSSARHSRHPAPDAKPDNTPSADQVWVNTKSGKYFLPGSRYYRKTKAGKYMTEEAAKQAGYTKAKE